MAEKDILDSIIDYGFPGTAGKSDKNPDLFLANREEGFNETIAKIEKKILSKALKKHKSTRSLASYLKMSQSQVVRKLTKHNLNNRLKRKLAK
jgi:transcriptional regulator of aromatic amino acid metabolism